MLFSYHTSTGGAGGSPAAAIAPATSGSTTTSSGTTSQASSSSGSFTGSSVDTRWGPVQVKITVQGGKITDVQAVVYPQENGRDQEINSYALPVLHDEAVEAQSAQIDTVSGATVTSDGYITSLQS